IAAFLLKKNSQNRRTPPKLSRTASTASDRSKSSFSDPFRPNSRPVRTPSMRGSSHRVTKYVHPGSTVRTLPEDTEQFASSTIERVNAARRKYNAPPVELSDLLSSIAQRCAEEMARSGKLEHSPAEWRNMGRHTLGENYTASFQSELTGIMGYEENPFNKTVLCLF
ncbi:unnamed protein product, partial [Didymodactylos carnosus]